MNTHVHPRVAGLLVALCLLTSAPAFGVTDIPIWSADSNQELAQYGETLASAGDVNGDGFDDILVGSRQQSNGNHREGAAFLYLGSAFGPSPRPDWVFEGGEDLANAGWALAHADVNADGYDDIIVGAPYFEAAAPAGGKAYLFLGSASGPSTSPDWSVDGDQPLARYGNAVASAGDVNGDGFEDVVVSAAWYENPDFREGRVHLYLGSEAGLSTSPAWVTESDFEMADYGSSLASGDINGDGFSDVVVGSSFPSNPLVGRLWVYHGSDEGLSTNASTVVLSTQVNEGFAEHKALSAGDVNADGFADVIVGAPFYDGVETAAGRAMVYMGSSSGLATSPAWTVAGDEFAGGFGRSVSHVGDVNQDGFGDVVVGQIRQSGGIARLYLGGPGGLSTGTFWTATGTQPGAQFGNAVSGAGDVTGDGYDDVLVGAWLFNTAAGRAYLFPGGLLAKFRWDPVFPEVGQDVQFIDESSGDPVAWEWDFNGDGNPDSMIQNPTRAFTHGGPWKVTLKVSDGRFEDNQTETVLVGASNLQVLEVNREFGGLFLEATTETNDFDVVMDWKGTPGSIDFEVLPGGSTTEPGTARGAIHTFDMAADFQPMVTPSKVRIIPTNAQGFDGLPWIESVWVFPYPLWLQFSLSQGDNGVFYTVKDDLIEYGIKAQFPSKEPLCPEDKPCQFNIPSIVPILDGAWGFTETQAKISGTISTNNRATFKAEGKSGILVAGGSISGTVKGSGEWRFGEPEGLDLVAASIEFGIKGTVKKQKKLLELNPQLALAAKLPLMSWVNDRAMLIGEISPVFVYTASFEEESVGGDLVWKESTGKVGVELKGTLKADLKNRAKLKAWAGGSGSLTIGVPEPFLRKLEAAVQFGTEIKIDGVFEFLQFEGQFVCHAKCIWTPGSGIDCPLDCTGESGTAVRLVPLDYERFGEHSARLGVRLPRSVSSAVPHAMQETTLFSNVFDDASPFLVELAGGRMLLWEHQDVADPVLQGLEIAWSFDDGSGFGPMALLADDTRAELSPVAAVDANGKLVAVWLRVQDPAFSTPITMIEELPLFYKELEVVSAVFDPLSGTWGPITALTNDASLDEDLQLVSDAGGNLLLTWITNPGGELLSTSTEPSTLHASSWDETTETWSTPAVVDAGLVGLTQHATAFKGTDAALLVQREPDAMTPDDGVLELYTWDGIAWSVATTFADGAVENRLPRIVYDGAGEGQVVWVRDGDLVHATLSDPTPQLVRAGSATLAFYGMQLMVNSSGNVTLLWPEVDAGAANLFATVYDSVFQVWSEDRRLTQENEVTHHGAAGYFGSDGVLRAAYLATQVQRVSQVVDLGGEMVTIENIPEDGATDLRILEHTLGTDLAVMDADLTILPPAPFIGEMVEATLTVHNAGDFTVGTFQVDLYVGEISAGGVLVDSQTVPGPFAAGATQDVVFTFTRPAVAGNLDAHVDVAQAIAEVSEGNNTATVFLENRPPNVAVAASATSGAPPLSVDLSATGTEDPDADPLVGYSWSFGDGTDGATGAIVTHVFNTPGDYVVGVTVTDARGGVGNGSVRIHVTGAAGTVPDGVSVLGTALSVDRLSGGDVQLTWGASPCGLGDDDYAIYEGTLGEFTSHAERTCSTSNSTAFQLTPSPGDAYYLVVPRNASWEGSYGRQADGAERPQGVTSCLPQAVGSCQTCGNELLEPGEVCDGANLAGQSCATRGFDSGQLACGSDCKGFDTLECYFTGCGNALLDAGEACDGSDLQGETCASQGFEGGVLRCAGGCEGLDASGCHSCGNGVCEPHGGEDCLSCAADCNGVQGGNPSLRYCCGDGDGDAPVSCADLRCQSGASCCPDPTLLTNGLVLRLEADRRVTTGAGAVTSWDDLSGRGNDLTALGDPTLVAAELNGLDVIRFDGVDDLMQRTLTLEGLPDANLDRTLFLLTRYDGVGAGGFTYGTHSECNGAFGLAVDPLGDLMVQGWCLVIDGGGDFVSTEPGTGEGWILQSAVLQADNLRHYKNGVLIDTQPHVFATLLNDLVVGAEIDRDPYVDMDVAAILVYDRALSDPERWQVQGYLEQKWLGLVCP